MPRTRLNASSDVTDTATKGAAFRRWFGKSVVVDKKGKPRVMYHGTHGDFDVFDTSGTRRMRSFGAMFTPSKAYAANYGRKEYGGKVLSVYLRIENPFDAKNKKHDREWEANRLPQEGWVQYAHRAGYDGAITMLNEYVVFDPTQVKSATANVGTFDPADPNIYRNPRRRNPTITLTGRYPSREDIRAAEEKFFPTLERLAGEGQTFYSGPFVVVGDRKGGVLGNLEIGVGTSSTIEGRTPVVRLSFIGVSPDQRGEGRGTALLNLVTAAADEAGLPVELDVDPQTMRGEKKPPMGKPALRAFYKKAGFATVRGMGSDFMLRKPRKQNPRRRNPAKKQTFSSKPLTAEEKEKLGRANVFLMDWVCDGYGDLPPRIAEIEALQRALTNVEARELLAWFDRNASGENFSGYR